MAIRKLKYKKRVGKPRTAYEPNTSGIIGVHPHVCIKGNSELYFWLASFTKHDNKRSNAKFSFNVYGEKRAFKNACIKRFDHCGILRVYRGFKFPGRIPVPWEYID